MEVENEIAKMMVGLANYYGVTLNREQIAAFVEDLKAFPIEKLREAIFVYRRDKKNDFFPRPAKLIGLIQEQDGRPGVEEAWALAPKDEFTASYLNDEIMSAWSVANDLLIAGDSLISARMAFREVYERTVAQNRSSGRLPRWWLSRAQGPDREASNTRALMEATNKNRLPMSEVEKYLEHKPWKAPDPTSLPRPEDMVTMDEVVAGVAKQLKLAKAESNET